MNQPDIPFPSAQELVDLINFRQSSPVEAIEPFEATLINSTASSMPISPCVVTAPCN